MCVWRFPEMGDPQSAWFVTENPIYKWMMTGVPPFDGQELAIQEELRSKKLRRLKRRSFAKPYWFWGFKIRGIFHGYKAWYLMVFNGQRKLGSNLPSCGQMESWEYTQWRMVCEFTSHNNERCETILNEGWCENLHHISMRSVRLYSMNGGVRVYIT